MADEPKIAGAIDPGSIDWQRIVEEMNVSFGILRYLPATETASDDIFLLYANRAYERHLRKSGYDPQVLMERGYVGSGNYLDPQMSHSIIEALSRRVQVHDKLHVTSMNLWVDYFITPMDIENWYYVVLIDVDREQRYLEKVERLGLTDALTGVGNRNALQAASARLRNADVSLGFVAVDLNGLKNVNDREGHAAGDRVIVETAHALEDAFPRCGVYRYGGDELVVLAEGVDRAGFEQLVARFYEEWGAGTEARASVGWSWSASSGDFDALARSADAAMYERKRAYYKTHDRRREA